MGDIEQQTEDNPCANCTRDLADHTDEDVRNCQREHAEHWPERQEEAERQAERRMLSELRQ